MYKLDHIISIIIVFSPFFGFVFAGLYIALKSARGAQFFSSFSVIISALLSCYLFAKLIFGEGHDFQIKLATWLDIANFKVDWVLKIDPLTIIMFFIVTTVSSLVHIYSVGYITDKKEAPRFMSYLSLFTFVMLILVSAGNLLQLFVGWEGVGLTSYLLIGFWYSKPSANNAAIKAFLVNRVSDIAFVMAMILFFLLFSSLNFTEVFQIKLLDINIRYFEIMGYELHIQTTINLMAILFTIAAMGKSAQIGLHIWLPDAMEGPTPVSALIHAATMVTAGIFLIARLSPIFELSQLALDIVAIVGAATAIFAATIALTQTDIKKIIAYSTCSQLGYMFFALGISAYPLAIFHLTTHAFFKALLFLAAGSVIHAMNDEQDIFKMGELYKKIPYTYSTIIIATLAITGFPFLSGYYSKDYILEAAYASSSIFGGTAWLIGLITVGLTAFYSWRLILVTFHGKSSNQLVEVAHESPKIMLIPLFILAFGSIFSGYLLYDYFSFHGYLDDFWNHAIIIDTLKHQAYENAHNTDWLIQKLPLVLSASGFILAFMLYKLRYKWLMNIFSTQNVIYKLFINKWYIDEIYHYLFVKPILKLANFSYNTIDLNIIDKYGPNFLALTVVRISHAASRFQSGKIYHYAMAILLGLFILIIYLSIL